MQDVLYLVIIAAFFAVCVGYVRALDRLVGPPDDAPDTLDELAGETGDRSELAGARR